MTLARPRPTQKQRRERTVGRVVNATIEALGEVGYPRTSVTEIGARAGVSQGGMFRHFSTRLDMVMAAAREITNRQLSTYGQQLGRTDATLRDLLEFTREASRAPVNAAWQELLTAARTDAALRAHLAPLVADYRRRIVEFARAQPVLAGVPDSVLEPVVLTIVQSFDGDALAWNVLPQAEHDETRLVLLEAMLSGLLPH